MDRLTSGDAITGILLALTVLVVLGAIVDAFGAYVLDRTAESVVLAARRTLIGRLFRLRPASAPVRTAPALVRGAGPGLRPHRRMCAACR